MKAVEGRPQSVQVVCAIQEESQVGSARREAERLARSLGLDDVARGRVGIAVMELCTNMLRHAAGGELLLQAVSAVGEEWLEVLAVDRGKGIEHLDRAMEDGHSTAGSSGTGLGAVRRASDEFDIFSEAGRGTVVLSRIRSVRAGASALAFRWGAVATNAPGEFVSGDRWQLHLRDGICSLMMADGLGHGVEAEKAAVEAARLFAQQGSGSPTAYIARAHESLRSLRGAAIAVAQWGISADSLTYTGVGNISAALVARNGRSRGLLSFNGTVGSEMQSPREMTYPWQADDRLVMHSDGIQTRWSMSDRPALAACHPAVVAAVLHRDYTRGRDDATIVVLERVH
ncbi:MAG: ATP-binding SpoIIE family protein phosphatase [Gemmatimonadaceae bacterium]